jgi:hypothetical protein
MKRERIVMFVAGGLVAVAGLSLWMRSANPAGVKAARVEDLGPIAGEYAPGFAEFVTDWVRRHYAFETALGAVFCSSPDRGEDGRLEWIISGRVRRGAGEPSYKRWLRAKRDLKRDVELWRKRGIDIRWSDFRIEVDEPRRPDVDIER